MNKMQFPKSNGQRFYEDVCNTIIKALSYFDEQQLIDVMEFVHDITRENYNRKCK